MTTQSSLTVSATLTGAGLAAGHWPRLWSAVISRLPGVALAGVIVVVAQLLHRLPGLTLISAPMLAIALGVTVRNLTGVPAAARPGIAFCMRSLLRLAVILLGLQLTFGQALAVGGRGLAIIVAVTGVTFLLTIRLGRLLRVDRPLAELIAAGTSICGASAVVATNTVSRGSDEDVAYAIACVTLFGALSMVLYPLMPALLDLTPQGYGLWAGSSIHEIAQVVAAGFQVGQQAGETATLVKLSRVLLLAPLVTGLGLVAARRLRRAGDTGPAAAAPVPWFVLGFLALAAVNSLDVVPEAVHAALVPASGLLLTIALAAMGLAADLRALRARGLRPLLLGAAAWMFITLFSLALVQVFG